MARDRVWEHELTMNPCPSKDRQTVSHPTLWLTWILLTVPASCGQMQMPDLPEEVYLFTSFRGSGDGLHLAWSTDAKHWSELHGVFLASKAGSGLMSKTL